jgi:hypothetical protein
MVFYDSGFGQMLSNNKIFAKKIFCHGLRTRKIVVGFDFFNEEVFDNNSD